MFQSGKYTPFLDYEVIDTTLLEIDIFHYIFLKKFQYGKPYYVPDKKVFLYYADPFYCDVTEETTSLRSFLTGQLHLEEKLKKEVYQILFFGSKCVGVTFETILEKIENLGVTITEVDRAQFQLLYEAFCWQCRMQSHRGHTPREMSAMNIPTDLSYEEIVHTNNYCIGTSEQVEGAEYTPIEEPPVPEDQSKIIGNYHLNGLQVTSYCRIRQTASMDMGRTQRQRYILNLMADKAKKSNLATLNKILDEVFPMVATNFSKSELIKLGSGLLSYKLEESTGFPLDYAMGADVTKPVTGLDCLIPKTLATNVKYLHEYLFGDKDYIPSETVFTRSEFVADKTGFGNASVPEASKYLIVEPSGDTENGSTEEDYTSEEENLYDAESQGNYE